MNGLSFFRSHIFFATCFRSCAKLRYFVELTIAWQDPLGPTTLVVMAARDYAMLRSTRRGLWTSSYPQSHLDRTRRWIPRRVVRTASNRDEGRKRGRTKPPPPPTPSVLGMKQRPPCELCGCEAAVFCDPDAAFLCWACDASVHGANFLVARHVRLVACPACDSLDAARCVSGAAPRRVRHFCASCDPDSVSPPSPSRSAASSSSSSCLSTSESTAARRGVKTAAPRLTAARRQRGVADERVEGVLLCWSRRMGLRNRRRCVEAAARVVGACQRATSALPLRVALSAALWFAIKLCEGEAVPERGGAPALRRLESCSGVPARLILAVESRISRLAERARVAEEGWAECS
ncbi:hypothetical protein B296_00020463 [Ensete ventricosum]|uniref:B box-type domain-containing protein n=1 Tax=Ensete ventricosum TaxID=4639 RepID=A0A426Z314_ENSVE|nr:hypothetical protein B296_00020463 [Ensete ventricosum]